MRLVMVSNFFIIFFHCYIHNIKFYFSIFKVFFIKNPSKKGNLYILCTSYYSIEKYRSTSKKRKNRRESK